MKNYFKKCRLRRLIELSVSHPHHEGPTVITIGYSLNEGIFVARKTILASFLQLQLSEC